MWVTIRGFECTATTVSEASLLLATPTWVAACDFLQSRPSGKVWTTSVGRGISRSPNIDSVLWLLVVILMHIYTEEETEQKKNTEGTI